MRPLSKVCAGRRRVGGVAVLLVAVGVIAGSLAGAAAAFAESATSSTGIVGVSVPTPVVAGAASTYTMTVTNTTSTPMTSIVASGTIPSGMTLKNVTGCARLGGNQSLAFFCSMPAPLAPGASETAAISLVASAVGGYQIPFGVSALEPIAGSPGAFNVVGDSATLAVSAQPGPTDIQVTGSSNNGSPPVGATFNYTFQVKTNGPLPASGVTFDDPLPGAIVLGSTLTVDNGSCTPNLISNSVHCDIGSLGVGQQSTITLPAAAANAGVFSNAATVAMTEPDTHPANNSVSVTVQPK